MVCVNAMENNELREIEETMKRHNEEYAQRVADAADIASLLGISPEKYIAQQDQDAANLAFLETKGFSRKDLARAKKWVETTDPDNLMLGEPTGDPFDIAMGQMRRGMLLETIGRLMKN